MLLHIKASLSRLTQRKIKLITYYCKNENRYEAKSYHFNKIIMI
jgi:hypothetical protein